jgi:osmotically-inducible protein OsmY
VSNVIVVRRGATPKNLARKIGDALVRSAEVDAHTILVDVDEGTVILNGNVRSWAERLEAERQAWAAPGITAVDNRLTIGTA